jgi:hypothetical protein
VCNLACLQLVVRGSEEHSHIRMSEKPLHFGVWVGVDVGRQWLLTYSHSPEAVLFEPLSYWIRDLSLEASGIAKDDGRLAIEH